MNTDSPKTAPLSLVVAAFATVYLVWGSTYLAIRFAIETLPPFIMAGLRFSIAGLILLAIVRRREPIALTGWHWFKAGLTGSLMLIGGNALVCWSEQYVASGPAALVIATVPLWLVVLDWLVFGGARPTWRIVAGLVIGLFGVFILIGPSVFVGGEAIDTIGGLALLAACVFWAIGSLYSRRAKLPGSPFLATAAQMTIAGALLLVIGALAGEGAALDLDRVSTKSVLALGYLIVFGAILGLTAYVWLLSVTTPARVSTYAYVNPVVALLLGYGLANEPLSSRVLLATSVILGAVILITTSRAKPSAAPKGVDEPSPDTGELDVADPVAQPRTGVLAMPPTADEETPRMSCTGVSR